MASARNWTRMCPLVAPRARRSPISERQFEDGDNHYPRAAPYTAAEINGFLALAAAQPTQGLSLVLGGGNAAHLVPEAKPVGAVDVAGELDWL